VSGTKIDPSEKKGDSGFEFGPIECKLASKFGSILSRGVSRVKKCIEIFAKSDKFEQPC